MKEMSLGKAFCPGCGAELALTSKVVNKEGAGDRIQGIIPAHNPLPKNKKSADVKKRCPGSEAEIGPIYTRKVSANTGVNAA